MWLFGLPTLEGLGVKSKRRCNLQQVGRPHPDFRPAFGLPRYQGQQRIRRAGQKVAAESVASMTDVLKLHPAKCAMTTGRKGDHGRIIDHDRNNLRDLGFCPNVRAQPQRKSARLKDMSLDLTAVDVPRSDPLVSRC